MEVAPINKLNLFSKVDNVGEILSDELILDFSSSDILKIQHYSKRNARTPFIYTKDAFVILTR